MFDNLSVVPNLLYALSAVEKLVRINNIFYVQEGTGRIINGTESSEGKYPFMVSLRSLGNWHFCGASILSPVHILTAAHCVSDSATKTQPKPAELMPVVGAHSGQGRENLSLKGKMAGKI